MHVLLYRVSWLSLLCTCDSIPVNIYLLQEYCLVRSSYLEAFRLEIIIILYLVPQMSLKSSPCCSGGGVLITLYIAPSTKEFPKL